MKQDRVEPHDENDGKGAKMPTTKHILVYSDSLTWGIIPTTRQRLPFRGALARSSARRAQRRRERAHPAYGRLSQRASHRLRRPLQARAERAQRGPTGHRSAIPARPRDSLARHQRLPVHAPAQALALRDWHCSAHQCDQDSAGRARNAGPADSRHRAPAIGQPSRADRPQVRGRGCGLPRSRAGDSPGQRRCRLAFFDSNTVTTSSTHDGVHLDADQHHALGVALAPVVAELLADGAAD